MTVRRWTYASRACDVKVSRNSAALTAAGAPSLHEEDRHARSLPTSSIPEHQPAHERAWANCHELAAIDCPGAFLYGSRMRHAHLVLLAVVLCTACGFFTRRKPMVPSDTLWSDANQAMQDEAWELAVQKYKALLEQYPFDP